MTECPPQQAVIDDLQSAAQQKRCRKSDLLHKNSRHG